MPTREIPRNEWRAFFDTFSQLHEGWLVRLEVAGEDVPGDQLETDALPLLGISADTRSSEADAIEVVFGRDPSSEVTHIIHNAERVLFQQSDGGGPESLEIESAEGDTTVLQFRPARAAELPRTARG